jgi:hypothetical protein
LATAAPLLLPVSASATANATTSAILAARARRGDRGLSPWQLPLPRGLLAEAPPPTVRVFSGAG